MDFSQWVILVCIMTPAITLVAAFICLVVWYRRQEKDREWAARVKVCSRCGTVNAPKKPFCTACGGSLHQAPAHHAGTWKQGH